MSPTAVGARAARVVETYLTYGTNGSGAQRAPRNGRDRALYEPLRRGVRSLEFTSKWRRTTMDKSWRSQWAASRFYGTLVRCSPDGALAAVGISRDVVRLTQRDPRRRRQARLWRGRTRFFGPCGESLGSRRRLARVAVDRARKAIGGCFRRGDRIVTFAVTAYCWRRGRLWTPGAARRAMRTTP